MSFTPTDDASIDVEHRIGQAPKPTKRTLFFRQCTLLQLWKAARFSARIMSVVRSGH
ncbi:MAG TPA: hypothetical protein GXZ46_02065 [Actinomycetales bacterium]|uniref:hypothetical protein n=1 Tax=uncultured Corynebacterium sp. TaxID=159447 RepID=UPI001772D7FE|nr:hypothetical protein [uncultured Corynebacterium sp.]HHU44421.1 hypothetical protein [Actinomycetales bacterium]